MNIFIESDSLEGSIYKPGVKPLKINQLNNPHLLQKGGSPKLGISMISISADSRYIAAKNENCPTYVWIWDLVELNLNTVLV